MNQNDNFDGNSTMDDSPQPERDAAASLKGECARLREDLGLCRRELAQVRQIQEDNEERIASLSMVETERDELAQLLAQYLSRPPVNALQVGGVRGWIARRLLGPRVPRTGEADPLVALIEGSELFDAGWYLRTYADVAEAGERPAVHYLYYGAAEGRAASPRFDTAFYVARYPDVRDSGVNPLVHYLQTGQSEGRLPVQPSYERGIADAKPGTKRRP